VKAWRLENLELSGSDCFVLDMLSVNMPHHVMDLVSPLTFLSQLCFSLFCVYVLLSIYIYGMSTKYLFLKTVCYLYNGNLTLYYTVMFIGTVRYIAVGFFVVCRVNNNDLAKFKYKLYRIRIS
jgi:hypothetical protein